jgi:hypothetical protein
VVSMLLARNPEGLLTSSGVKSLAPARASWMSRPVNAGKSAESSESEVEPRAQSHPHLERLSLGEVSLVSSSAPVRRKAPQAPQPSLSDVALVRPSVRLARAYAVRWIALAHASSQPPIRLLNAARKESLASLTRVALMEKGWRKIHIGNAPTIRQHSLVLYASSRSVVARRLAAHLGFRAVRTDKIQNIVVLLGRDAALPRRGFARA